VTTRLQFRDAEFIRVFHEFGFSHRQLAREYKRHTDTIRNILHGNSHKPGSSRAGSPGHRNDNRKLQDEHVRFVRLRAKEGQGEKRITVGLKENFGVEVSRSTVRQVMTGITYRDVT
jgi:transposase